MDMPPQLAVGIAPADRALNRPFAEEPNAQQMGLLAQQMLRQQQQITVQQMRIDSLIAIQKSVEAQNERLQGLAVATIQSADARATLAEEALAVSRQENLAQAAEIAALKALLVSQNETYTASQEAARQALAAQARAMEAIKEQNRTLNEAFAATEKMLHEIPETRPNHLTFIRWESGFTQFHLNLPRDSYLAISGQAKETRTLLQQIIQNQASEAQNIGDQ